MSSTTPAPLSGRSILLGVCGGIAAYKACDLARLLVKAGAQVRVILTRRAAQFVSPLTFSALTGQAAVVDEFPSAGKAADPAVDVYSHLNLPRGVDCMLVAPASADMLGKMAAGIADDLLSTAYLANSAPVLIAPAMNVKMWEHAAVQANVKTLQARGHLIIEPGSGLLACGDEGQGRLAEIEAIAAAVQEVLSGGARPSPNAQATPPASSEKAAPKAETKPVAEPVVTAAKPAEEAAKPASAPAPTAAASGAISAPVSGPLSGKRIVVTAGATREYLDPVRFITNASSGTLGLKVCEALLAQGASVELLACGGLEVPTELKQRLSGVLGCLTAFDLQSTLQKSFAEANGLVMLAAVADYAPAQYNPSKRKKDGGTWNLDLGETPDVLAGLKRARKPGQAVLAVSLEDTDWLVRGQIKAGKKGADAVLAVELGSELPFGESRLHCALVRETGILAPDGWRSKEEAAELLVNFLVKQLVKE